MHVRVAVCIRAGINVYRPMNPFTLLYLAGTILVTLTGSIAHPILFYCVASGVEALP